MKKNIILVLLTFCFITVYSQDYLLGKIITVDQDTIKAVLKKDWNNSAFNNISYQREPSSQETLELKKENILLLYFDALDLTFEGLEVDNESVIVKRLVEGRLSLYEIEDKWDDCQFLVKDSLSVYKLRLVTKVEDGVKREYKKYINMLTFLMQDCSDATSRQISKTAYSAMDLSGLIMAYNSCFQNNNKGLVDNLNSIEEDRFNASNGKLILGFGGDVVGAGNYSFGLGTDLGYFFGKPNSIFKFGFNSGLLFYSGKSQTFSASGSGFGFSSEFTTKDLFIVPISGVLRLNIANVAEIGSDIGTALIFNGGNGSGWYFKPHLNIKLSRKAMIQILYRNVDLGRDNLETLGAGIHFIL